MKITIIIAAGALLALCAAAFLFVATTAARYQRQDVVKEIPHERFSNKS